MQDTPAKLLGWIAAGILLSATIPAATTAGTGNQQDCDVHEPIRILEDKGAHGFVWDDPVTGEEVYRPGSGVVAGDGTAANPYVIEGILLRSGIGLEAAHKEVTSAPDATGVSITAETARVHNTTVEDGWTGIGTGGGTNGVTIENVTMDGADIGLDAYKDNNTTWQYNEISNYTDAGMHVNLTENVTVRHTNFEDTGGIGLDVENTDKTVDARHNWWGCADGPDDSACDDVVGDAVYDPWLTAPNPDAGST
jgi:hypothetical protein